MVYDVDLMNNNEYMFLARRLESLGYTVGGIKLTRYDGGFLFPGMFSIDTEHKEINFRLQGIDMSFDEFKAKPINFWLMGGDEE